MVNIHHLCVKIGNIPRFKIGICANILVAYIFEICLKKKLMNDMMTKLKEMDKDVRAFKVNSKKQEVLVTEIQNEIEALLLKIQSRN